jgi:hypothetical protein
MIRVINQLRQVVPPEIKRPYWRLKSYVDRYYINRPYSGEIDLRRTLVGGEGTYDAVSWAERTGDWQRVSTPLANSHYVGFLAQYQTLGERILEWKNFEHTAYFKNALRCIEFWGDYFGQRTRDGIQAQARAFITLYERIKNGDASEVSFPSAKDHAVRRSRPRVRETLTARMFQIVDGHHRLAIAWILGDRKSRVKILRPASPSGLQSLVLKVSQTQGRRELYQPIDSLEFDESWGLVRRCHDRFAMMVDFLASRNYDLNKLSVVDLACSYGWFVKELSKKGCDATGIEADSTPLHVGRIAYGLSADLLIQRDFRTFARHCGRTFDVVLLLSVLHYFPLKRAAGTPEEVLREVDAITGSVLFFDTGQSHEEWWRNSLPEWNDEFIIKFIKNNTSFRYVTPLGRDSDNVGPYRNNYARTLFACYRA